MIKKILYKILWFIGRHTRIHLINKALVEINYNNIIKSKKYSEPKNLINFGFKVYSQSDEDGILEEIFKRIVEKFNIKMMSIGFLLGEEDTVIWRGPMVHGAIKQFIEDVEWEGVDNLVVDLPPGTGDAHLSLIQTVPLSGGVIVTTPQDVALLDVKRGIQMFKKLDVPVLGIIENMSYLQDGDKIIDIFGRGGGKAIAEKFGVPFLGEIPIDPEIRKGGDSGQPIVYADPESKTSKAFTKIAETIMENL